MSENKPDLVVSDLLVDRPVRRLFINVADISLGRLTLIEALDIAEASGIDADDFVRVLESGSLRKKAGLLYAFAWVVARRIEPELTYAEVCTYQLEVKGSKDIDHKQEQKRAEVVVAVASLAGVSPDEAEQMTMAEVAAVSDLHRKRNVKRTAGYRRRAG